MTTKIWIRIAGFGRYEVSSEGDIRRIYVRDGRVRYNLLRKRVRGDGYCEAILSVNGMAFYRKVHALVAESFIGPLPDGLEINHKDSVRSNNSVTNLEYVTHAENMRHMHLSRKSRGLQWQHPFGQRGSENYGSKLNEGTVRFILDGVAGGKSQSEMAMMCGVCRDTVSKIVLGKTWTHVVRG